MQPITLIIPARYASTRFRGKLLALLRGKTVIQRVYEQCLKVKTANRVIVATDDNRIYRHVEYFSGEVVMSPSHLPSGTARCAFAAKELGISEGVIVNVQGDEPFLNPQSIEQLIQLFDQEEVEIATLIKRIDNIGDLFNPNRPKVIVSNTDRALYFSRQAIPYVEPTIDITYLRRYSFYKHIGLYAFHANILPQLVQLPISALEEIERLEQLRWLAAGYSIHIARTDEESLAIDTIEDFEKALEID